MTSRKRTLALILLLLFCQLVIRPKMSYINGGTGMVIGPDFLLLAVVFAGLGRGVSWGVITGFLVGLIQDSFAPVYFGLNGLIKVIVGFISGKVGAWVFLHTVSIVFLLIIGLKYLNDVFVLLFDYLHGHGGRASQLLLYSPGSALYTSIAGLVFLRIMIFMNTRTK